MAEAPEKRPLNILLLGKTGNGKSATGNTILQKRVFVERPGGESVTKECELGGGVIAGRQIYVLDTPGSMDTNNPDDALKILAEAIYKLQNCIDAFVIVLSYNLRMTNEEVLSIKKMEELFGPEVFDFVVFVFTHADNFDAYKKRADESRCLEEFVVQNGGKFLAEILVRCNYRFRGINNYAKMNDLPAESLKIVTAVDEMIKNNQGKRYQSPYYDESLNIDSLGSGLQTTLNLEEIARRKVSFCQEEKPIYPSQEQQHQKQFLRNYSSTSDKSLEGLNQEEITRQESFEDDQEEISNNPSPEQQDPSIYLRNDDDLNNTSDTLCLLDPPNLVDREDIIHNPSPQQFIDNKVRSEHLDRVLEGIYGEMNKSRAECFPANALVKVPGRGDVKLKDLAVGDKVMTLDNNMKVQETEVYIFGHALEKWKATFINIQTKRCKLQATLGHLIYTYTEGGQSSKAARDVKQGDVVVTVDRQGRSVLEEVREIWETEEEGLFAPFTLSGSMVVEGVLVSCYVDVLPDSLAHLLLGPVRMLYRCSPAALTTVSKVGQDGIPVWMKWWLDHVF